jgi:sugar O-acyltransferase (sialic acid O-acetyltransferase NeuD family)
MSERVVIIGAGGHAKVVISTLRAAGHSVSAVFDDDLAKHRTSVLGVEVLGATSDFTGDGKAVIAVGDNATRERMVAGFKDAEWMTVVHPAAYVDQSVRLGRGTVVFAGAVIQPDTVIGAHVIINTGATVDHDCVVGDYSHLAPGSHLAGESWVGRGVLVGIGAVVVPGRRIGERSVIGAGSVVVKDVPRGTVAFGVPASARKAGEK